MGERDRARLEAALVRHYGARRVVAEPQVPDGLVAAMVAEDERARRAEGRRLGTVAFVAAQARFVPWWTWVAQVALVGLMCAFAQGGAYQGATQLIVGLLSAATVLVGVPTLHASKLHRVDELEYACPYDVASVMVARMVVLGCSSALCVALMVGVAARSVDASAFAVALWACQPYFLSCAGSLVALRKATPPTALALCVSWVATCSVALLMCAVRLPDLYGRASLSTWAVAAAAALAWLVREAVLTFRAAAAGLDAFSPQMANTYH